MDIKLFDRILALGNLIGQAGLAYIETNRDFQITSWNNGATHIFGYSEEQMLGRRLDEFIPISKTVLSRGSGRQTSLVSLSNSTLENTRIHCEIYHAPIVSQENERKGVAILAKDISKRVAYKTRLEQQIHHLEEIYAFAPIGIFSVNLEGEIVEANSEFAWMLGYESQEMIVNQVTDFATQIFYDIQRAEEFMVNLLDMEKVARFRCRLKRKGTPPYIWSLCFAKTTRDASGKACGFNGYAVDIRETIKAEQQLQQANEKLTALSEIDGLTQIPNRRKFDSTLASEWQRHTREHTPLSIILCDIDFFKRFNDTYGHQAGDDCLKQVARELSNCVTRSADLAARYGGEEFAVILPNTDSGGAAAIAEKIRAGIQALAIEHRESTACPHVTLSLGVATSVPENGMTGDTLLSMADKALYRAKNAGRNQCVHHDDPAGSTSA